MSPLKHYYDNQPAHSQGDLYSVVVDNSESCMLAACLLHACCMLAACDIFAIRLVVLFLSKLLYKGTDLNIVIV